LVIVDIIVVGTCLLIYLPRYLDQETAKECFQSSALPV